MITTNIRFNGEFYTCRIVKDNEGDDLIIGSLELLDALHSEMYDSELDGFASREAQKIDDEIFYYTSESDFQLSDEELIEVLKEANPDWF